MKSTIALAAIAAFGLSGAAMASDLDFNLPSFGLNADASGATDSFSFSWSGEFDGFSFQGNYDQEGGTGTWASDTRLQVYLDGVEIYNLGGFSNVQNDWDFQGSGSNNPGPYSHGPDSSVAGSGDWEFVFTNGWHSDASNTIVWNDSVLTLHNAIPAPGALALLGLAGLVGAGRRRRA